MSDNKNTLTHYLRTLNLTRDEAMLYIELLKQPTSHLELARATGINRTKVYRLADNLEKRSLITVQTDDRGTFLVASDPATLEVELVTQEENLKNQRAVLKKILPSLNHLHDAAASPLNFEIRNYEGIEGLKQMLWHELKAEKELLVFGSGEIESLVENVRWAEQHRAKTLKAGYTIREIINPGGKKDVFTRNQEFVEILSKRSVSADILPLEHQIAIYNDTVDCWRDDQKVGFQVINKAYADLMRKIFEQYWTLASSES